MCNKNFSDVANKNYPEVIQSVFSKYKVKEQTRSLESTGRILEFDISCSMYDCLAYEETNGFFDECDCPPPEFWIAYIDDKLFVTELQYTTTVGHQKEEMNEYEVERGASFTSEKTIKPGGGL